MWINCLSSTKYTCVASVRTAIWTESSRQSDEEFHKGHKGQNIGTPLSRSDFVC